MRRRVSSHDVARIAGVSQSTVSLVLNGRMDVRIPETTRQRVFAAARELNYSRNAVARALVTGKTNRIGIVADNPLAFMRRESYYGEILKGVMQSVLDADFNLLFHSAQYMNWRALSEDILSGGTDGVILVGRSRSDELTKALYDAQFPTVCISYVPELPNSYVVDCDNEMGGYLAAQYLISLGHRQIGILDSGYRASWIDERQEGIIRALQEAGLPSDHLMAIPDPKPGNPGLLVPEIIRLTRTTPRLTSLFFFDEWYAMEITEALIARGLRVPEEFSTVSFNSSEASARARPPLTSVYQPLEEIGRDAANLLVELVNEHEVEPGVRRLPVHLEIRESTASVR